MKRKENCQSDIVVGQHFNEDYFELSDEEQNAFSDYHEMFFVNELLKDELKFEKVLAKLRKKEKKQRASASY